MSASPIVAAALGWEGTPYRHQGARKGVGCDCLGLLRGIWHELIGPEPFDVPAYSADPRDGDASDGLERAFCQWLDTREGPPRPGDILLLRLSRNSPPRHCAIMLEKGEFVHAQERLGVVRAPLAGPWRRRLAGTFYIPPKYLAPVCSPRRRGLACPGQDEFSPAKD